MDRLPFISIRQREDSSSPLAADCLRVIRKEESEQFTSAHTGAQNKKRYPKKHSNREQNSPDTSPSPEQPLTLYDRFGKIVADHTISRSEI